MRLNLNLKFTLFIAGLLLLTIGAISFFVLQGVADYQHEQREISMQKQADFANQHIQERLAAGSRLDSQLFLQMQGQRLASEIGTSSAMRVLLYDMTGTKVGDSLPIVERTTAVEDALRYALQNKIAYFIKGETMEYLAPLQGADEQIGVIHFQVSVHDEQAFYNNLVSRFIVVGVIVLVSSLVLGLLYMNRQAQAIVQLKQATDHIRNGKYLTSPTLQRQDELGELSRGIFEMNTAIQTSIEGQRNFINNISHEFKTPLTSIKAYTDLLAMYQDDPNLIREARAAIEKESARLYDLVQKVLQLAALDKYEFEQHPEQVELQALIEDLCSRMKGKADKFGLTMTTQLQPSIVWADRESIIHIFINVLDNAIKYNIEGGRITVTNRIFDDRVEIQFRDTGIGIPLERREKIFDPFYTVNKDRARQSGGTGLGLALVQQFVRKQQGTIRIEDHLDQGTSFIITFQLYKP
ncbi:HAMP domain-containing histidine kinase [Paenibacillus sp. CAU 1523]|uniref:histidine kinase n=1 Tax=Paenibacillus arenosi TaxID=2774142 RepID=A0ABR9B7S8_9BACL|nr:HAMP domain-containing histidine kinase [Paenibacillus arenosi]